MNRKLIKQGGGGLTFYVPKKWTEKYNLKAGDELNILEKDAFLQISPSELKTEAKSAMLEVEFENFNIYRSLIGGLYRSGYEDIKVKFKDIKVISLLQKVVDSLYGMEILDIDEHSCTIRSVYKEESAEVKPYLLKVVHTIKTMQKIITGDLASGKNSSQEELFQFRNNVLKQRDLIVRIISVYKLADDSHLPYSTLASNLWNIARSYYDLYLYNNNNKISKNSLILLNKINSLFANQFADMGNNNLVDRHKEYALLMKEALKLIKDKKESHLVLSYGINILMMIQSCNSLIFSIGYQNKCKEN